MIAGERAAAWLGRLVRIPSVTPDQAGPRAGVPGEGALARQLARWFEALGGEVHQQEVLPGRPNVYGLWRGRAGRWCGVDAHTDTVGVERMAGDPFSGRIEAGRVYGRGAVDTKATLAVALALLEAMHEAGRAPEPNLLVAATVDEEVGTRGAPAFAAWLREQELTLDELVVAEPTGCVPVHGHQGVLRLEFEIEGVAAHSAQPAAGRNAITAAARLVLALEAEGNRLRAQPAESALGSPALTVTLIRGGSGINVVPDRCSVSLDRRIGADEKAAAVRASLADLACRRCPLPVSVQVLREIDAFYQPPDTPWLRQLADWCGAAPSVVSFCTNAWAYSGVARQRVVLGPGSLQQAHADEEWVAVAELEKLAGIYSRWWGV
jgi:acetylornithine deacetylase/succinyl-diaminopimelate desuccinylase-like protein